MGNLGEPKFRAQYSQMVMDDVHLLSLPFQTLTMCNAKNHEPGCTCGWGGIGHSGGTNFSNHSTVRSVSVSSQGFGSWGRAFGLLSMRDMAAELGHSLLFPVLCWYCNEEIYLFASPNGAFTIFDRPGLPWPKHWCSQYAQTEKIKFSVPPNLSKHYPLPRADSTQFRPGNNGNQLKGIIVKISTNPPHPRIKEPYWTIDIYGDDVDPTADGQPKRRRPAALYRIKVGTVQPLGSYICGVITCVADVGTVLINPTQLLPPCYTDPS